MVYNQYKALQEQEEKYPIDVGGKVVELPVSKIGELIKKKLKKSKVVNLAFEECGVSIDQLDNLQIVVEPLEGKVAETDATTMKLIPDIIEDILATNFYIPLHEICGHYAVRKAEERGFFFDPEEVFGMQASCAGMMEEGYNFDQIWNILWSKIGYHFHDESDGREFMKRMFEKAKKMLES